MSKSLPVTSDSVSYAFEKASGSIDYSFTNDYMFREVLRRNKFVLKNLICSLLHLQLKDIISIEITNPILPGDSYDDKEFILDIEINLNNSALINLEMQVINEQNWPERSLSYLCRRFDQLGKGQDYMQCKPTIHIGFLDFTPFKEYSEFYATYKLLNIKNHHLYSDKFTLCVVDLTHIDLATDEDKSYGINHWAKLFKSTTWEEIKMIAKTNPALSEASESLYMLNADDITRQRCQARKEYIEHQKAVNEKLEAQDKKIKKQDKKIKSLSSKYKSVSAENKALSSKYMSVSAEKEALSLEIERLRAELAKYQALEDAK